MKKITTRLLLLNRLGQGTEEPAHREARAIAAIERNCLRPIDVRDASAWWDTAIAPNDIEASLVDMSVSYLERSGSIVRHPKRRQWIQIQRTIMI
jgi:hypothetical protein